MAGKSAVEKVSASTALHAMLVSSKMAIFLHCV